MDELVKQCRDCIDCLCGECKYEHLQKPGNFVPCMNALLGEAADAIEELAAFKAQITDGHFYCMRDGVLYALKYETPKAKSIQLPRIEFAEEGF